MGTGDEGTCTDLAHLPLSPSLVTLARRGWMAFPHWLDTALGRSGTVPAAGMAGLIPWSLLWMDGGLSVVHSGVFLAPVRWRRPREE